MTLSNLLLLFAAVFAPSRLRGFSSQRYNPPMPSILIIGGTNRPGANAHKLSALLPEYYARAGAEPSVFNLSEMPREVFDPASYAAKSPAILAMQKRILDANGLHIVTPEYNGSFPGVLKYFIDMLKFPESFNNKPVAFTGEAQGMWGALRAVEQLQAIFGYRNAYLYPDRVFIPNVATKIGSDGKLIDPDIATRLAKQAAGFTKFVSALTSSAK
jgi:chromate reductase, NAD(P)H dehydrogenase (quinone)